MMNMIALVDSEAHWTRFYIKQSEGVFIKVMNVFQELEGLGMIPSLSLAQLKEEISKKVRKIQTWLLPLVMEKTENYDPSRVPKSLKGF